MEKEERGWREIAKGGNGEMTEEKDSRKGEGRRGEGRGGMDSVLYHLPVYIHVYILVYLR